ncbi:exodeoxyribonuclease III [Arcobacter sp. CECT 8989]|uniref:exodeoxyribonuclease III n=1 Tax=Arcobacter sp. CECT 8989 TaxID=2044509 RepID=UPI00100A605F|nr:exodeoxyribonuclease III [Arcobacter sp. CECT 8989]RXJ98137.1 exodeoxyribonuclease III [Arcobacter sp. CECT 8989]
MVICSWNVNGLKSIINNGLDYFLRDDRIDIYCLQEVKMQEDLFSANLFSPKFSYWNVAEKKGYSGVTTIVNPNLKVINNRKGIDSPSLDMEGRVLTTEFEKFILVNTYAPHSHRQLKRLEEKEIFMKDFLVFIQSLKMLNKPIIITGDLNVAHQDIDLYHYKNNKKNAGFLPQERQWLSELEQIGFIDIFRQLKPNEKQYSWWGFAHNLRERDIGWRIDYFLVENALIDNVVDCYYLKDQLGSDHCPVILEIDL